MSSIEPLSDEIISERREKLHSVLDSLSKEFSEGELESKLEAAASDLVEVYADGYRQMYSELYLVLYDICDGDDYNLVALLENMGLLRDYIRDQWFADKYLTCEKYPHYLYGCLLKLYDHLSLEYQRYIESEELRTQIIRMSIEANDAQETFRKVKTKTRKMQTEIILILSIFAAIIMTFSGGLTFLGNALAGMSDTDPYKISFVILLCGIVMSNVIFYLMYTVNKIVTDFYTEEDEYRSHRRFSRATGFKHWYVVLFNALLLSLLIIDLVFWHFK